MLSTAEYYELAVFNYAINDRISLQCKIMISTQNTMSLRCKIMLLKTEYYEFAVLNYSINGRIL